MTDFLLIDMEAAAKVVKALMECGPSYSEISRRTGVPIPTVRYILRKRLPRLGFSVKAAINYGALGLQRYLVIIKPNLPPNYMSRLLNMFGELMYLNYYTYLMRQGEFLTIFNLPPEYFDDFRRFLDELKSLNIVAEYSVRKLLYMRVLPFRVDCFDFRKGVWRQNWTETRFWVPEQYEDPNPRPKLDKIDLLILKEVQKNAFIKYIDLAKILGLTRQTIKRHFEHIAKTIYMYAVFWVPPWNPELISIPMIIEAPNADEARSALINIPFNHAELRTEDDEYLTLALVPSIGLYKVVKYVSDKISFKNLEFMDMTYTLNFVIHHNLYNNKAGWLNPYEIGIEKIIRKIRLLGRGS